MITTRFGSHVQLISPVDWNSGWVQGMITYTDGNKPQFREIHTSDLKADGGLNEIMTASDAVENNLCRDCNEPMQVDMQPQRGAEPIAVVTCKNKSCRLYGVTLSVQQYWAQNDEQLAEYRTMVAAYKARKEAGQ